jgi:hypothetical protein
VKAAEEGAAFCEECAKLEASTPPVDDTLAGVDPAAQAATLEEAAKEGTPFCEECEKLKHAA